MGAAELCCDSLFQTSSRQVRQEGVGKVDPEWVEPRGGDFYKTIERFRIGLRHWENNIIRYSGPGLC